MKACVMIPSEGEISLEEFSSRVLQRGVCREAFVGEVFDLPLQGKNLLGKPFGLTLVSTGISLVSGEMEACVELTMGETVAVVNVKDTLAFIESERV